MNYWIDLKNASKWHISKVNRPTKDFSLSNLAIDKLILNNGLYDTSEGLNEVNTYGMEGQYYNIDLPCWEKISRMRLLTKPENKSYLDMLSKTTWTEFCHLYTVVSLKSQEMSACI